MGHNTDIVDGEITRAILAHGLADLPGQPLARAQVIADRMRVCEAAARRTLSALAAERGHALRQTGMTQADLARELGVSQPRVAQLMRAARHRDPLAAEIIGD